MSCIRVSARPAHISCRDGRCQCICRPRTFRQYCWRRDHDRANQSIADREYDGKRNKAFEYWIRKQPHHSRVRVAGLVTSRQQPQTASGIIFVTLEDEHGLINVIVWRHVAEMQRRPLLQARLLAVEGQWENVDGVSHLIAHRLKDLTPLLGVLDARSRDFH